MDFTFNYFRFHSNLDSHESWNDRLVESCETIDGLSLSSPRKTSILATQTAVRVHSELGFYALNPFAIMNHQDEKKSH